LPESQGRMKALATQKFGAWSTGEEARAQIGRGKRRRRLVIVIARARSKTMMRLLKMGGPRRRLIKRLEVRERELADCSRAAQPASSRGARYTYGRQLLPVYRRSQGYCGRWRGFARIATDARGHRNVREIRRMIGQPMTGRNWPMARRILSRGRCREC